MVSFLRSIAKPLAFTADSISLAVTEPKSLPSSPTALSSLIWRPLSLAARSRISFLSLSLLESATARSCVMRLTAAAVAGTASWRGNR